jgi:DNA-binding transcriptional LysR family regulator
MYPGIELRLLRYVVAVAEELHFTRAAMRLHVAQPSLSRQIRDLENELGVDLFNRSNRQVQLTHAGRKFVKEAAKALSHSERAAHLAKTSSGSKNETVSIGYSPHINLRLLSIIRSIRTSCHPELRLDLVSSHTQDQVQALMEGTIQAGLVTLPMRNESLVAKSLLREPLAVVVPETHPLAAKHDLSARELNGFPVISIPRELNLSFYDHLYRLFNRLGYKPNVVQEVTTEAEALYMVAEGVGITIMKQSTIPPDRPGIVYRRLREPSLTEETGIAYRRGNHSARLQDFLSMFSRAVQRLKDDSGFAAVGASESYSDPRQLRLF